MIVCECLGLSEKQIREQVRNGAEDLVQIARRTGAGTECGGCCMELQKLLQRIQSSQTESDPPTRPRSLLRQKWSELFSRRSRVLAPE